MCKSSSPLKITSSRTFWVALHSWKKFIKVTVADNGKNIRINKLCDCCWKQHAFALPLITPCLDGSSSCFYGSIQKYTHSSVLWNVASCKLFCPCHCAYPVPTPESLQNSMRFKCCTYLCLPRDYICCWNCFQGHFNVHRHREQAGYLCAHSRKLVTMNDCFIDHILVTHNRKDWKFDRC